MRLSELQKYILKECYSRKTFTKHQLESFYRGRKQQPSPDDIQNIITKSVERLIARDLVVGYGKKTAQKWFINEIRLTRTGRQIARALFGTQQHLPLTKGKYVHTKKSSQSS